MDNDQKLTYVQLSKKLHKLADEAYELIADGVPDNTRRVYRSQWAQFVAWCKEHNKSPLPASGDTLVLYLTDRSKTLKISSLQICLAAITTAHREAGHEGWMATHQPGVRILMRGLRRTKGEQPTKKEALTLDKILKLVSVMTQQGDSVMRAMVLIGYFGALRRSELLNLQWKDITDMGKGIKIRINRSKTDKDNLGQTIFIPRLLAPHCPSTALMTLDSRGNSKWLFPARRKGQDKPLSVSAFAKNLKRYADLAGMDASSIGGHSLRSGFVTQAARDGAEERDIMRVTRHKSVNIVRGYIQETTIGESHPGHKMTHTDTPVSSDSNPKDGSVFGDYTDLLLDILSRA